MASGIALASVGLAGFLFSVAALVVQRLDRTADPPPGVLETVFVRCVMQLVFATVLLLAARIPTSRWFGQTREESNLLVLRSAQMFAIVSLEYVSYVLLPLGDAVTLHQMAPFITAAIAVRALGEPWHREEGWAAVAVACGVACLAHPDAVDSIFSSGNDDDHHHHMNREERRRRYIGVAVCLLRSVVLGVQNVVLRSLGTRFQTPVLVSVFSGAIFGIPAAWGLSLCIPIDRFVRPEPASAVAGLIAVGAIAFAGQSFLNLGLQRGKAASTSIMPSLEIVFAFIWQTMGLTGGEPDRLRASSIVGASLVVCAMLTVVWGRITRERAGEKDGPDGVESAVEKGGQPLVSEGAPKSDDSAHTRKAGSLRAGRGAV